jgi:hypothetical protein
LVSLSLSSFIIHQTSPLHPEQKQTMKNFSKPMKLVAVATLTLGALTHAAVIEPPRFPEGFPSDLQTFKARNQFLEKTAEERARYGDEVLPNIVGGTPVDPPFKYSSWIGAILVDGFQFCAGTLYGRDAEGVPLFATAGRKLY